MVYELQKKRTMKIRILLSFLCIALSFAVIGQNPRNMKGRIVDSKGEPISGAAVFQKGGINHIATSDGDGTFEVFADEGDEIIVETSEGYKKTVVITDSNSLSDITMGFSSGLVDIGFGLEREMALSTASVSSTDVEQIDKRSAMNLANSLFGNVLGLTSLQTSDVAWGSPARFSIRGQQTLSDNNILILVDGLERPIDMLTLDEVESVSVLRDAAAVALYGYRGINGVLSIKTKRGKLNSREINVSYDHAFTSQGRKPEFADAYTYGYALNEALRNDGLQERYNQNELNAFRDGTHPYLYANVNWMDEVFKNTSASNMYNISFRGGGDRVRYFTAANLQNNSGFINNEEAVSDYSTQMKFSKLNLRTNLDVDLSPTTKMQVNIQGMLSEFNRPGLGSDNLIQKLYTVPSAAYPVQTHDGIWGGNSMWGTNMNPVALIQSRGFSKGHNRALYADAKIIQDLSAITNGLSASIRMGYDNYAAYWEGSIKDYEWASDAVDLSSGTPVDTSRVKGGNIGKLGYSSSLDYQTRHFNFIGNVDYKKSQGDHDFLTSLIYSFDNRVSKDRYNTFYRQNIAAYFNYIYQDKYIADLALVYSGSNRLAPGHKFALSPTLSAAWVVSQEEFLRNNEMINFLKLRASAGLINADFIPANDYWSHNFGGGNGYPLGNNAAWLGGLQEYSLPTQDIKNERALKYNFGVDAVIAKDLTFTGDVFYERRDNIFVSGYYTVSGVLGNYPSYANEGIVNSYGFELGADLNKTINDFSYHLGGKFTLAKSEIKEQLEAAKPYDYMRSTGKPVGQIFGLEAVGFFIDNNDILNSPSQEFSTVKPGDIKYKDQNNDGVINDYDVVPIGYNSWIPEMYFSFDAGLEFKGLGINATFQGVGNYSTMLMTQSTFKPLINNTTISDYYFKNRWTPETAGTAMYPRLSTLDNENNYQNSTVWLADASYLKLRNFEIYYKLPENMLSNININKARVYLRGVDLLSFDSIKILDPESTGIAFPLTRSINVGIALDF